MSKHSALKLLLLALLTPSPALAQEPPLLVEGVAQDFRSPQRFWFEFKLGPYRPGIDDEFGGAASPYKDIFGEGQNVMFNTELEVEVWRPFGTLAIGGSIGYYTNSAAALSQAAGEVGQPTGSETSIQLLPLALLFVYRFDWAAERWKVPLVPYVKFGFNYTLWWMDIDGNTSQVEAGGKVLEGKGGTFGWQLNAGVAFLLDVLEPSAAKALDVELGINHTYLFFELAHQAADGLGSSSALMLGDTTWNAGMAFEF